MVRCLDCQNKNNYDRKTRKNRLSEKLLIPKATWCRYCLLNSRTKSPLPSQEKMQKDTSSYSIKHEEQEAEKVCGKCGHFQPVYRICVECGQANKYICGEDCWNIPFKFFWRCLQCDPDLRKHNFRRAKHSFKANIMEARRFLEKEESRRGNDESAFSTDHYDSIPLLHDALDDKLISEERDQKRLSPSTSSQSFPVRDLLKSVGKVEYCLEDLPPMTFQVPPKDDYYQGLGLAPPKAFQEESLGKSVCHEKKESGDKNLELDDKVVTDTVGGKKQDLKDDQTPQPFNVENFEKLAIKNEDLAESKGFKELASNANLIPFNVGCFKPYAGVDDDLRPGFFDGKGFKELVGQNKEEHKLRLRPSSVEKFDEYKREEKHKQIDMGLTGNAFYLENDEKVVPDKVHLTKLVESPTKDYFTTSDIVSSVQKVEEKKVVEDSVDQVKVATSSSPEKKTIEMSYISLKSPENSKQREIENEKKLSTDNEKSLGKSKPNVWPRSTGYSYETHSATRASLNKSKEKENMTVVDPSFTTTAKVEFPSSDKEKKSKRKDECESGSSSNAFIASKALSPIQLSGVKEKAMFYENQQNLVSPKKNPENPGNRQFGYTDTKIFFEKYTAGGDKVSNDKKTNNKNVD